MNVTEFHERLKELYLPPPGQFTLVDVPAVRYAVIPGRGDPAEGAGQAAAKWLYSVAHLVKPLVKERMGRRFAEPPLEYLFWGEKAEAWPSENKEEWYWQCMIVFVDWITEALFQEAVMRVTEKLGPPPGPIRLDTLHEGTCIQYMHLGPYEAIGEICHRLYSHYLPSQGLEPDGHYHEIYLNDPARNAPSKRRIVIRQPVS